jgi:hypothetical protein
MFCYAGPSRQVETLTAESMMADASMAETLTAETMTADASIAETIMAESVMPILA